MEAAFGFQCKGFLKCVQAAVAEPVFALDEGFRAESAEHAAGDQAVLVVPQELLDSVGRVSQTGGLFRVDR